ncbi:type III-D CRISPR-associated protein Csx19 [Leptolyngbya sp. AN03gr2]|uniref:type III-D CRISPR-associated protein Csx19 n=1 Tax=unclassified Leptolyngbya TaxID=2650499 RepID=UPI003D31D83D
MIEKLDTQQIQTDQTLQSWLEQHAKEHQLKYLLAHAEDGVIWGYFSDLGLAIAHQEFPEFPQLRRSTLQQCRIFGEAGEVLLWRDGMELRSRFISGNPSAEYIPEEQILWGTQGEEKGGFTKLRDGQQGLSHAVPLTNLAFNSNHRPVRLLIHHYIHYNKSGIARIHLSRLVTLLSK